MKTAYECGLAAPYRCGKKRRNSMLRAAGLKPNPETVADFRRGNLTITAARFNDIWCDRRIGTDDYTASALAAGFAVGHFVGKPHADGTMMPFVAAVDTTTSIPENAAGPAEEIHTANWHGCAACGIFGGPITHPPRWTIELGDA